MSIFFSAVDVSSTCSDPAPAVVEEVHDNKETSKLNEKVNSNVKKASINTYWYRFKHSLSWKQVSKVIITILHNYIPFYELCSRSRMKRIRNSKQVIDEHLDNGFYFGYSLCESPIIPPPGETGRVSKNVLNKWLDKVAKIKVEERFEWTLNERFHSPLTLSSTG